MVAVAGPGSDASVGSSDWALSCPFSLSDFSLSLRPPSMPRALPRGGYAEQERSVGVAPPTTPSLMGKAPLARGLQATALAHIPGPCSWLITTIVERICITRFYSTDIYESMQGVCVCGGGM